MIGGLQLRLVGEDKAVSKYNKTPGKSPGYQAAMSMARLSGQTRRVAPTSKSKATPGFMEIDTNSQKDCWYCG